MVNEKSFIKKFLEIFQSNYQDYSHRYGNKKIGVLISGGIDSSLIGYFTNKYFKNINLLTLNTKESLDLKYVEIINKLLKQKLIIVNFSQSDVKEIRSKVEKILNQNNLTLTPTNISLAAAFYLLLNKAKEEKIEVIFTGQGPDILLGGYKMYEKIPLTLLNKKIKKDLGLLEIDKKRDFAIADYFNIELVNPYLEKNFVDFCLKIPPELKINQINEEIYEKYLSRKVGECLNLPKEIILRHKKALQYSTKIRKYI